MKTWYKLLLAATALIFLASLTDMGSTLAWGVLKPVSAILFLVFYIGQLLHKEAVKYDEEFSARMAQAKSLSVAAPVSKQARSTSSKNQRHAPLSAGAR